MDRVQMLTIEISRAYKLSHKDLPKLEEIRMEAAQISDDLKEVPDAMLAKCYNFARINGRSGVPLSRDIAKAWYDVIKPEIETESKKSAIEYNQRHECPYCPVVALRLGVTPPDTTEAERRKAAEPPGSQEIQCVLATIGHDRPGLEFWNQSPKSPYRGML